MSLRAVSAEICCRIAHYRKPNYRYCSQIFHIIFGSSLEAYLFELHACMHTYTHTYIHTYIHAYIHTYIHTYTQSYETKLPDKTPRHNSQTEFPGTTPSLGVLSASSVWEVCLGGLPGSSVWDGGPYPKDRWLPTPHPTLGQKFPYERFTHFAKHSKNVRSDQPLRLQSLIFGPRKFTKL